MQLLRENPIVTNAGAKRKAGTFKNIRNHGSADHDVIHHQAIDLPESQVIVDLENITNSN